MSSRGEGKSLDPNTEISAQLDQSHSHDEKTRELVEISNFQSDWMFMMQILLFLGRTNYCIDHY